MIESSLRAQRQQMFGTYQPPLRGTTLLIDNTPAKLVSMSQIRAVLPDGLQLGMHTLRVAGTGSQAIPLMPIRLFSTMKQVERKFIIPMLL